MKKKLFQIVLMLFAVTGAWAQTQTASVEMARILGGSLSDIPNGNTKLVGGYIYKAFSTKSTNLPVVGGVGPASTTGSHSDIYIVKMNAATGAIVFSTYFGGSGTEDLGSFSGGLSDRYLMEVVNDNVYFAGFTNSTTLPVTSGGLPYVLTPYEHNNGFVAKVNCATGAIGFCTYFNNPNVTSNPDGVWCAPLYLRVVNGDVYINWDQAEQSAEMRNSVLTRMNGTTGVLSWAKDFGGYVPYSVLSGSEYYYLITDFEVSGNSVYATGYVDNYKSGNAYTKTPISTDGSRLGPKGVSGDSAGQFYARYDIATGAMTFLHYYPNGGAGIALEMQIEVANNGDVYLQLLDINESTLPFPVTDASIRKGSNDIIIAKFNSSNVQQWAKRYGALALGQDGGNTGFRLINNKLYFKGRAMNSPGFPVTNGSTNLGINDIVVMKLDLSGNVLFGTYEGTAGNDNKSLFAVGCNEEVYIVQNKGIVIPGGVPYNFQVTDGSAQSVRDSWGLSKYETITGKRVFATNLPPFVPTSLLFAEDGKVLLSGDVSQVNAQLDPVTNLAYTYSGGGDSYDLLLNTCPSANTGSAAVSPASQSICSGGVVTEITMAPYTLPSTAQTTIYVNGTAATQPEAVADYQWQYSANGSTGWMDIAGATAQNFFPTTNTANAYYRRLAVSNCCGVRTVLQTGNTASVLLNGKTAPTVNAGSPFITCATSAVTLGGAPTATPNGTATSITSYSWSPTTGLNNAASANPTATLTSSQEYLVTATDNNGCVARAQTNVTVFQANAGLDVASCAGTGVVIGTPAVPGVTYSWSPITGLSNANIAQPIATPGTATTYTLTATVNITGGGTCPSTDAVLVTPTAAPTATAPNGFAGADKVVCWGGTALLGTAAQSGFSYTWAPGNYLTANITATTTFQPGSLAMPKPSNPMTYYVTAAKNGCYFVDSVKAAMIKADAGVDGCGPRYIGTPDATPSINETYTWTKVSGPGNFIPGSATNLPQVAVGASVGGTTIYQLTVSYGGTICTDQVTVTDCGCPMPVITVNSPAGCPSYSLGSGNVALTAATGVSNTAYSWSTTGGVTLSAYTGSTVYLTNANNGTVTVTATNTIDPSVSCSQTITVNNPAWSFPTYTALDVYACSGVQSVSLTSSPNVFGYNYSWKSDVPGLDAYNIYNPKATVTATTAFPVIVTDVVSGCKYYDTAVVTVPTPSAPAGLDVTYCNASGAPLQLGKTAVAGTTYSWTSTPSGATFLPNATVANPTVTVAATTTFHVTATHTASGCVVNDDAVVTIATPAPTATFTNSTFCPSSGTAIALPQGPTSPAGMSYQWTSSNGVVVGNPYSNTTANTGTPLPTSPTTYTLTWTTADGCSSSASITLTPTVIAPDAGPDKTICLSNGPVTIGSASNPTGGSISYSWSPTTGLSNSTSPNPTFTPPAAGTYTFTLTKTDGSCSSKDVVIVTVNDFTLPAIASPTICNGATVQLGTAPVFGASYSWTPTTGLSNPLVSNPLATLTSNTSYTLTATSAEGCVATATVPVNVLATPAPTISMSPILNACIGSTPTLNPIVTPNATYYYLWTPNDGTLSNPYIANPTVNVSSVSIKMYGLTVTNATTGCSNTASVYVVPQICDLPSFAQLGDKVWRDDNNNGIQETEEPGIAGVTVTLYKNGSDGLPGTTDDIVVGSTITDAYGKYLFQYLTPSVDNTTLYNVGFTPLPNYKVATQTNTQAASGGTTTTTGGSTEANGNDASATSGRTGSFYLVAGQSQMDVDAGMIFSTPTGSSSIGNYVWYDANSDGVQGSSTAEPGLAGVTVTLYSSTGDVLMVTTTDATGHYMFNNLPNGSYSVGVTPLPNTTFTSSTGTTAGNTTTNSDIDPTTGKTFSSTLITITSAGTVITGIDAGLMPDTKSSLGDLVWNDLDHDGMQDAGEPGVPGVTMTLLKETTPGSGVFTSFATTTTNATGKYVFTGLDAANYKVQASLPSGYTLSPVVAAGGTVTDFNNSDFSGTTPTTYTYVLLNNQDYMGVDMGIYNSNSGLSSIGDNVWNDVNGNGVYESGTESGVEGITVTLLNASGLPVNNPATGKPYVVVTDKQGNYLFVDLPNGTYKVQFSNLPANTSFSPTGAGTPATDSDPNPVTGITSNIIISAANTHIRTIDAGIVPNTPAGLGSIGDKVWVDDGDGIQEAGEQGLAGVTVNLYYDANNDGAITGSEATTPYATTVTNAQGGYLFPGLAAGNYIVGFTNLPSGYIFSPTGAGTTATDSDPTTTTGLTSLISLAKGQDNLTIDAGVYNSSYTNSIGDRVWYDSNMDGYQSNGEKGMPGVTVNLLNSSGTVVASVVTDATGAYSFKNLPNAAAGAYTIQVLPPSGFDFTIQGSIVGETLDSKASSTGLISVPALTGGTNITNLDAGLISTKAALGDYVWYDANGDGIQNAGEAGVPGVTVTLYGPDGTTVIGSAITDANGRYLFSNLEPNSYVLGFSTLPNGLVFTTKNASGYTTANGSDVNVATGKTDLITLASGEVNLDVDGGLVPQQVGAVSGTVWYNKINTDNVRTSTEPLVPGILVTLKDANGNVVGTTLTDGNGFYLFTEVPVGTGYTVTFSGLPAGASFITQTIGTTDGSDANTGTGTTPSIAVTAGQVSAYNDAGINNYIPLPVALNSFEVVPNGCSVQIKWQSGVESGVQEYILERSTDNGDHFERVTSAAPIGNSHRYNYIDESPVNGNNLYRLQIVDNSGNVSYSPKRLAVINCGEVAIKVYPNPSSTEVNTDIHGVNELASYEIYDAIGKVVLSGNLNGKGVSKINVSNVARGVYTLKLNVDGNSRNYQLTISK